MTAIDDCLDIQDALSISVLSFPPCTDGQSMLVISDLTSCKRPSSLPIIRTSEVGDCISLNGGQFIKSTAFQCINSITTVSELAPTKTSADQPPAGSTVSTLIKHTTSTKPAPTVIQSSPTIVQSGQVVSPAEGLSQSDKIALGCGVGIALPGVLLAFFQWQHNRWPFRGPGRPYHPPPVGPHHPPFDPPPPYEVYPLGRV